MPSYTQYKSKSKHFKYYQPNEKDLKDQVGDCQVRAFSKVLNISWLEAFEIVYANEYNLYSIKTYELNSSINGERIDRQYEQSSHSRVRIYTQTQA